MKRIATITFHASYNFGSNLQAYALQEYIKKLFNNNVDYNIINLRKYEQNEMYKIYDYKSFRNIIKRFIFIGYKKDIKEKQRLFETFISNHLNITKEFSSLDEIKEKLGNYDYYISGSDQIWNMNANDFDWANLLEFTDGGIKLSYSASLGPASQNWSEEQKTRFTNDLKSYNYISVREEASYNTVKKYTDKKVNINVDPTLLLKREEWINLISSKPVVSGKYIFLYDLSGKKESIKLAKKISRKLKLPIVIANNHHILHLNGSFKKYYRTGPLEFLNIINNAALVLSSSFHGTVFSIIFNKPFFSINGINDFRISTLLKNTGLEGRSIDLNNYNERIEEYNNIDFKKANSVIDKERNNSINYLSIALNIK